MTADDTLLLGMQNLYSGASVSRAKIAVICAALDRGALSATAGLVAGSVSPSIAPLLRACHGRRC